MRLAYFRVIMAARQSPSIPVGAEVQLTTYLGEIHQGEVTAYDPTTKLLVVTKSPSAGKNHEFRIVNLNYVSDFKIIREASGSRSSAQDASVRVDIDAAIRRAHSNVTEKTFMANTTPEGRRAYDAVRKAFECSCSGEDIVVLEARIKPPYTVDSIEGPQQTVDYLRKLLSQQTTAAKGKS
ncbi:protein LSM12 homolog B-like [Corticium candelabrum]|uniref:protein LSM12 homolog B-like n=1 Tax=Corticium candelabrum TaxID=121492 RepID=UPI002E25536D|nr:protein LSM12 homolog B-like [Corticium candelabrum]